MNSSGEAAKDTSQIPGGRSEHTSEAARAGRGVIFLGLGKMYFMLAGWAIYFVLPRLLGSKVEWGIYLLVTGAVSVINNVMVAATIQGVSRFTAQSVEQTNAVKRAALSLQLVLGGTIALAYLISAPWIAAWERDAALTRPLRLSAPIILCYAVYSVFVGSANGLRLFNRQATLDATFATIRATCIIGAGVLGLGVAGSIAGWGVAAALIIVVAAVWLGFPPLRTKPFSRGQLLRFMTSLATYTLLMNLIMRVDLFLLKRFAVDIGTGEAAARVASASTSAGLYGTAQVLAFIPYQAIMAVAFVIFPLVSKATFEQDLEVTRTYVRQTLRWSLIFVGAIAAVIVANPAAVIGLFYEASYQQAGPALRILSLGMVSFSLLTIATTILNGAGRTHQTIGIAGLTLACAVIGNAVAVPRAASLDQALWLAATMTGGAMTLGLLAALIAIYRMCGAGLGVLSFARCTLAGAVVLGLSAVIPGSSKFITLAKCALLAGAYVATLIASRELGAADLGRLLRILPVKKRGQN